MNIFYLTQYKLIMKLSINRNFHLNVKKMILLFPFTSSQEKIISSINFSNVALNSILTLFLISVPNITWKQKKAQNTSWIFATDTVELIQQIFSTEKLQITLQRNVLSFHLSLQRDKMLSALHFVPSLHSPLSFSGVKCYCIIGIGGGQKYSSQNHCFKKAFEYSPYFSDSSSKSYLKRKELFNQFSLFIEDS